MTTRARSPRSRTPSPAATRASSSPRCATGVNAAIKKARDAGLYVIALDTPPDPADTVDITFATDNREAGKLDGQWAAAQLDGKPATIALLDLFDDKIVSVDYDRDQGFLEGMGIDVADPKKNGDEAKTGKYTGGKGGDVHDRLQRGRAGRRGRWPDRDGDVPRQEPQHQPRLHDQRADRCRGERRLKAAGIRRPHRLGRWWMRRRRERQERHYRRDRPAVSAQDGDSRHGGHRQDRPRW